MVVKYFDYNYQIFVINDIFSEYLWVIPKKIKTTRDEFSNIRPTSKDNFLNSKLIEVRNGISLVFKNL